MKKIQSLCVLGLGLVSFNMPQPVRADETQFFDLCLQEAECNVLNITLGYTGYSGEEQRVVRAVMPESLFGSLVEVCNSGGAYIDIEDVFALSDRPRTAESKYFVAKCYNDAWKNQVQ